MDQMDLFRQLRAILPNDIDDETVRELAETTGYEEELDMLAQLDIWEDYVEDPDELTNEQIEARIFGKKGNTHE